MLTPHISRRAGGLRDCVLYLSRSLQENHDIQIEVVSVDDEFAAEDRALWDPLSVHLSAPRIRGFRYAPMLAEALLSTKPDLVHTHGLWTFLSVATTRWSRSGRPIKPYIISPQGMLDPWALRNSGWKKRIALKLFERRHLENAFCLHAVNPAEARAIRDFGLRNPICVIPNGVKLADSIGRSLPAPWSAEFGNGRKVLLYLGRLHPKKGLLLFLRSWQKALPRNPGWVLAVAGWDQAGHRTELEALASQLRISDSVKFLGPLFGAQRDAAYENSDAVVLPSRSEGQPLGILEAWAHARPVLMTTECNLEEGFEAGAAIRMECSIESEADALQNLFSLSGPALRETGRRGQALAKERFSWPKIAAEMFAVYQWMAGAGPRPGSLVTS